MTGFFTQEIGSWSEFMKRVPRKDWIFRGQPNEFELTSTLERSLEKWQINLDEGPAIENELIREFRRRVAHPEYERIHTDGAPVRLLDCTYSPFVAAKFALEDAAKYGAVIYCFNGKWCDERVPSEVKLIAKRREKDKKRTDTTFVPMYLSPSETNLKRFIHHENPFYLNERLTIQQGVFLCPGNIGVSFMKNIRAMSGWNDKRTSSNLISNLIALNWLILSAN